MASSAICLLPRTLKKGMKGEDVRMMKRALSIAGYGKWKPYTLLFGDAYVTLLKKFQHDNHQHVDGIYGPNTHRLLARFYDRYGISTMNKLAHAKAVQNEPAQRMVSAAIDIYNWCKLTGRGTYTQSERRMSIIRGRWRPPFSEKVWLWEDCSSSCTGICWIARVADPNHLGYNLQGYTGTMAIHGMRINSASVACFAFYGHFPYKHVTMCIGFKGGRPLVFSWGSGLPRILDAYYRSDFNHWRGGYARNIGT
jgi:hypothetical protein